MKKTIRPAQGPIQAKIALPGSKDISLRALILSALAEGVSEIFAINTAPAIQALIKTLRQLGIAIQFDEKTKSCIIAGCSGKFPKKQATVWCQRTVNIYHFLVAACANSPGIYYFDGPSTIREKANSQLLDILCRQGLQLIPGDVRKMPFTLIGTESLEGGTIVLNTPRAYQVASPLLMIAPFARSPFSFNLNNKFLHQTSIDMTSSMMAEFGVLVHHIHQNQLMVPVPQRYLARDYVVEPDFTLGAYFFAAAALTSGEITIQPIKSSLSKQPASKFLSILEKMGCRVNETHQGLTVKGPKELLGIEVSMRDFSDIFLALTILAPFAKSPTRIAHLGPLRHKELEQMTLIKNKLTTMGVHVELGSDWIKIFPGVPQHCEIDIQHGYQLAIAFSIMGLRVPGIIVPSEKISKVYPEFFPLLEKIVESENINA